jgi:hypothetical protein
VNNFLLIAPEGEGEYSALIIKGHVGQHFCF